VEPLDTLVERIVINVALDRPVSIRPLDLDDVRAGGLIESSHHTHLCPGALEKPNHRLSMTKETAVVSGWWRKMGPAVDIANSDVPHRALM
jgi:hypothetical protein